MTTPTSDLHSNVAHNADDDAFKALPYRACLNCRQPVNSDTADLCLKCSGVYTGEYVELDSAPWYGYNSVEKHGEPWDAFIDTLDVDSGGSCTCCDAGIGSNLHDEWTDDGHRWGSTWKYMALILVDGVVKSICEDCATVILPPIEGATT